MSTQSQRSSTCIGKGKEDISARDDVKGDTMGCKTGRRIITHSSATITATSTALGSVSMTFEDLR